MTLLPSPTIEDRAGAPDEIGRITAAKIITALAVAIGIGLRWSQLGRASLWFDEGYTAWVMSLSPSEILRVIHVDTAPPLYYLMLRGWVECFGHSEAAMRSMSALFSSVTLILFYPLAKRLLHDSWAVAAAVSLLAVSEMQVAYAHEARFYSLIALVAEIDLLLVLLAIDGPKIWKYIAIVLAWSISLYVNNMMAVYLAMLGVAWLIFPGRRSIGGRIADVAIVASLSALAFLPWLPTMLEQSARITGHFWVPRPTWTTFIRAVAVLSGVNDRGTGWISGKAEGIATVVMSALILIGLMNRKAARTVSAIVIFGFLPVIFVYFLSQVTQPIFMERAFIASTVVTPLLIAFPIVFRRKQKWPAFAITAMWMLAGISSLKGSFLGEHQEPWRDACRWATTSDAKRPLYVFVANESELLFDYYHRSGDYTVRADQVGTPAGFFEMDPPRTLSRVLAESDVESLRSRLAEGGYDEVVLVLAHQPWGDPKGLVLKTLADALKAKEHRFYPDIRLYRFEGRPKFVASQ